MELPHHPAFALRRTAQNNRKDFSAEAIDAVLRDFYVDDLLKSFKTTNQAVEVTKELQQLLANGGFQLTKVMSNEREVLDAFPPEHGEVSGQTSKKRCE